MVLHGRLPWLSKLGQCHKIPSGKVFLEKPNKGRHEKAPWCSTDACRGLASWDSAIKFLLERPNTGRHENAPWCSTDACRGLASWDSAIKFLLERPNTGRHEKAPWCSTDACRGLASWDSAIKFLLERSSWKSLTRGATRRLHGAPRTPAVA